MSRENVETKGRRYLTEGRLEIIYKAEGQIHAYCLGSDVRYRLGYWHGHWACSCEARGRCAHLVALQLVTRRPQ